MTAADADSARRAATWTAPVRACLAGEDLDWLEGRCCCVALDLPTTVSLARGELAPRDYLDAVWSALERRPVPAPKLRVRAQAPIASGLATSTSLIVALLRACGELRGDDPPGLDELARSAYKIEFAFDNGGGMDQLSIVHGGVLLMDGAPSGLPRIAGRAPWPRELALVVICSQQPKSTHDHIREVRRRLAAGDPRLRSYTDACGAAADAAFSAVERADLAALAAAVNAAHDAMRDLQGMSTPLLEALRDVALRSGLPGVKLTGAGGGGALVAVAGARDADELVADLRRAFARSHPAASVARADATGPCWSPAP